MKSHEEETESSTDNAIEDLEALKRELFDCIEVVENQSLLADHYATSPIMSRPTLW